jgi:hypothetical protein
MRALSAALLVAATGCAQLFGLDETSGPNTDPSRVSLAIQRWSVGASVQKNPQDLTMETASFLVDDGAGSFTKVAGEYTAAGTFSAAIPDGTPPVLFSLPDLPAPIRRLWANPARERRGVFVAFEHSSPREPLPNSSLMLTAALPSPYTIADAFRVEAIGAWMAAAVMPAQAPDGTAMTITAALPYSAFSGMTSSPAARITSQDVVVVERYSGNILNGIYQVPPFDQTDGADPINANLVPVPANKPLNATLMPATYMQRFSAVRPAVSGLAQSWAVTAAPGWSIGSATGPRLHAGVAAATDTVISTMFGNPFESLDWRSVVQFSAQATRTFMGTVAMTLSSTMYAVAEPTAALAFDMPAGLPINVRVNQVPLSTDGMAVPLDLTRGVVVDAITDKPASTLYLVALYEVVLAADLMTVERKIVVDALATGEPKVTLPPELFEVGHYYYFDFRCLQGGYVDAATGDLQTVTLPYSVSRADSAVFQVVAP